MKAYVIKNKKGKYFAGFDRMSLFTIEKDITDAIMYRADRYEKIELESVPEFKDCQVVEITIAEGDLEEQLAEKDKEIGKLTRRLNLTTAYKNNQKERANKYYNELKQVRKQVCDKIRNAIDNEEYELRGDNNRILSIHAKDFNEILDQIEKGEEK